MRNRLLIIGGVAVLVIGATVLALGHGMQGLHGQGRQRHPGPGFGPGMVDHMAKVLNLTADQTTQIKALVTAAQATEEPRHEKLRQLHEQLEAVTANGQFDETKVRAIANEQAGLMADSMVEHERLKSKIYGLLTAEQRTKANEMHKQHGGPRQRHGGPPPGE